MTEKMIFLIRIMSKVYPFYGHSAGLKGNFMSNFYPASYTVDVKQLLDLVRDRIRDQVREELIFTDPLTFRWSEQGFMLLKCLVFMDSDSLDVNLDVFEGILSAETPAKAKALGRKICGYDDIVWKQYREDMMYWNLLWKFSQNAKLAQQLLDTGDMILAEATTNDRIWGIGLKVDDPMVQDQSQWRGQNLLGKALMRVRSELRASEP